MASKKALLGGTTIKVENMSGFDKSAFHAFTAPLGSIVPMRKQLVLPGSGKLSVKISAQLPPLATDAFLRSHLKVEAFLVPMRLCYGGFQSWFANEPIVNGSAQFKVAKLPRLKLGFYHSVTEMRFLKNFLSRTLGVHTLADYFGVKLPLDGDGFVDTAFLESFEYGDDGLFLYLNIFPFIAYHLCWHHWYRNKLVQRPVFAPATPDSLTRIWHLPYLNFENIKDYVDILTANTQENSEVNFLNGDIWSLRQRNYGFDYFTTALPSAQDGQPISVDTSSGSFTISALRLSNAMQHFAEINQLAGPDYIQALRARYNRAPSSAVAQRPILLGSADFPMYTSGVEQSAQGTPETPDGNPFAGIGARYGRAHAEGNDFVCEFNVDEPSYLMVMCSLVPEANYATGISKDMAIFTQEGSITDLPCAELERAGLEPIEKRELSSSALGNIFGYQPRYMWHKAGQMNEISGLFRKGASLEAFIPQRDVQNDASLSSDFLEVAPTDLDNVTAVAGEISQYGVMIDSAIQLYVSEPLGESVMPSLVDPAAEHGQSVYLHRGGVNVDN